MKKIIILLIIFFCASKSFSQFAAITNVNGNRLYCGVENPLEVAVSNYDVKSIKLKITNGNGYITGENGKYKFFSKESGIINITAYSLDNNKEKPLDTFYFRVFPIPDPIVFISGQSEGSMNSNLIKAQKGIYAKILFFDFDINFEITSFNFYLIKKDGTIIKTVNIGPYFSAETISIINTCKHGDTIMIKDARCKSPDDKIKDLSPIFINID